MSLIGLVTSLSGTDAAMWSRDWSWAGPVPEAARRIAEVERLDPARRWALWSAADLRPLLDLGTVPARVWDCTEVHRLRHGGWDASPRIMWCDRGGLPVADAPSAPRSDLFDFGDREDRAEAESLTTPAGYLRGEALDGSWQAHGLPSDPARLLQWAHAALDVAEHQHSAVTRTAGERPWTGPRALAAAVSESAAALLCLELERGGLPIDRDELTRLITASAGPRPSSLEDELASRAVRDAEVLRLVPGRESTDLRNPAQVRELLLAAGIEVRDTRKWTLESFREAHPVVPALLAWRARERIATTYGWRWLDAHVGPDDRLRGRWTACDGAAGRMTAENGLHNLPAALRPAVRAAAGHRFVRADLGQIEPRVLAAVSGDRALAQATTSPDLYAPVAARLGVDRAVAKVAVLAAMYGQRSGTAGEALAGLRRAYPVAMELLEDAAERGARGEPVRTFGGRLVRTAVPGQEGVPVAPPVAAGRGRFARNAVIQGSAAELFKAWAATIRATTRELEAEIVLCLHDEVLVHVPTDAAPECAALVERALTDAARRWLGSQDVRFVADVSVIERWSEAKG
ncbi:MAG: DNA polymerase [Dermatophilaceae bacterium]